MATDEFKQEYVEVYYKNDLIYRGFLVGIDDNPELGERNFIICGIHGDR